LNDRTASQRISASNLEEHVSRFLLAVIRNCGIAIAISVFFAAARGPSHPPAAADTLAAVEAKTPESTAPVKKTSACDQSAGRVCRLVDAGQRMSERTP
jgi:hypothetical protein